MFLKGEKEIESEEGEEHKILPEGKERKSEIYQFQISDIIHTKLEGFLE